MKHARLSALLLPIALVSAFLLFRPLLDGPFLLDDYRILPALSMIDDVDDRVGISRFLIGYGGFAGGRILSMASFLLDDFGWPADPYRFKLHNLLLHLLNGVLLLGLLRATGRALGWRRASFAGVLALLWTIHPLHVSTVALPVQRMTILSGTFSLAALWYLISSFNRQKYAAWRTAIPHFLVFGTLAGLAVLSKENGALTIIYAATLAWLLKQKRESGGAPRLWWMTAAGAGALLIAFAAQIPGFIEGYSHRNFNWSERLLTQSRILWDYVARILLFKSGGGLFADDYSISRGLFHPATTSAAVLGAIFVIVASWRWRAPAPLVAAGVAWFLGGHLLESTIVPLELYFEHRNYLPMVGVLMAALWIARHCLGHRPTALWVLLGAVLVVMATSTYFRASYWSDKSALAKIWLAERPDSERATQMLAQTYLEGQNPAAAAYALQDFLERHPRNVAVSLQVTYLNCIYGQEASFNPRVEDLMKHADPGNTVVPSLRGLIGTGPECGISLHQVERLLRAYASNPRVPSHSATHVALAEVQVARRDLPNAVAELQRAFELDPVPEIAVSEAGLLASAGLNQEAAAALDKALIARHGWRERFLDREAIVRRLAAGFIDEIGWRPGETLREASVD